MLAHRRHRWPVFFGVVVVGVVVVVVVFVVVVVAAAALLSSNVGRCRKDKRSFGLERPSAQPRTA